MSNLTIEMEVAAWAWALASPAATPAQRCELIIHALAAEGLLARHSATPGGALFVVRDALESTCD